MLTIPANPSFEDKLRETRYRPSGFDYMRVGLAIGVVLWHTVFVCYGNEFGTALWRGWIRPFPTLIIPLFFALSGFLVASSLERCRTVGRFLALRAIRIFPALCVEVTLSALILGPIFTTYALADYFSSSELYRYFLNTLGIIHYSLPGVFDHNPQPSIVNGQLWTVPYELECYIVLTVLVLIPLISLRHSIVVAIVVAHILFVARAILGERTTELAASGRVLVVVFLCGVALYLYRASIPRRVDLAAVSFILCCALTYIPKGSYFIALPATYLTVYLGTIDVARSRLIDSGDYSYGIFLYGYPIQQAIAAFGPWAQAWYVNLGLSLPAIFVFAALSWHLVEKHVLKQKHRIKTIEDAWCARRARGAAIRGFRDAEPAGTVAALPEISKQRTPAD